MSWHLQFAPAIDSDCISNFAKKIQESNGGMMDGRIYTPAEIVERANS